MFVRIFRISLISFSIVFFSFLFFTGKPSHGSLEHSTNSSHEKIQQIKEEFVIIWRYNSVDNKVEYFKGYGGVFGSIFVSEMENATRFSTKPEAMRQIEKYSLKNANFIEFILTTK